MKLVVSDPKTGKSYQMEVEEDKTAFLKGKKIGEEVEGSLIGLPGYALKITGGSDKSGFPMRKDIPGGRKIRAYLSQGPGFNPQEKGERKKKMVRGNEVSEDIMQINAVVSKEGSPPLDQLIVKKEGEKKE